MSGIKGMQWGVRNYKTYRKIFVSLPMKGRNVDEIEARQRDIFHKFARPEDELIDSIHVDVTPPDDNQLWYLGLSVQKLGEADLVIFASDWRDARGCRIEHAISELYKIPRIYENWEIKNDD